jgi:hypothetical protein
VPTYVLVHAHPPHECGPAYAAWIGFDSPLSGAAARATCGRARSTAARTDRHEIWWEVDAPDAPSALALLPEYVASRTVAREVSEVRIP